MPAVCGAGARDFEGVGGVEMKPIIFSAPMVQAILDGKKTQTRRVIKIDDAPENWKISIAGTSIVRTEPYDVKLPRYAAGDILWVRETWAKRIHSDNRYYYKADNNLGAIFNREDDKWRSPIFMPRKAARIFLRVKTVRVERLQEITLEDIEHEGLYCEPPYTREHYAYAPGMRIHWIKLWDSLNAKRGYGWDTNPWVWVIEFEKISKEEAERLEGMK
jgi:hypothetical protein